LSYLLDTNVLSELKRKLPDPGVVAWFAHRPAATLFLSVLTLGEIRKGIQGVADEKRRLILLDWLETDLPAFFSARILPVDTQVADRWGRLQAAAGRPIPAIDSLLAATALTHDLVLVTRNTRDFEGLGVSLINPWSDGGSG
jgi:predicted nucleic acid-binding protein